MREYLFRKTWPEAHRLASPGLSCILNLSAIVIFCCGGVTPAGITPEGRDGNVVTVTRVDDGNTIEVRKGDRIVVRLDENPTTGYSWALDKDAGDSVALQNSDFSRPGETVPGAGGQRDFTFAARNEGSANLIFKRWRQWEGDTSIVERVGFTVRVVDTSADDK